MFSYIHGGAGRADGGAGSTNRSTPMKSVRSVNAHAFKSGLFARYLNLTTGYVSQLERGAKRPTGPALVLFNVIRRRASRQSFEQVQQRSD